VSAVERVRSAEVVAGYLAAAAITAGLIAVVYRPVRIGPAAMIVALVAVTIGGRHQRLAAAAVAVTVLGWVAGMAIAIGTNNPLY
jgi:hypothetical protein